MSSLQYYTQHHYSKGQQPFYQQPFVRKKSLQDVGKPIALHNLISQCIHQIYFENKKLSQLEIFRYISSALHQRVRPNVSSSVMYQIIMGKVEQVCEKVRELIKESYRKLITKKQQNNDMKHHTDSWNVNFNKFRKANIQQNMNKVYGPITHIICTYHNSLIDCNKQVYDLWKVLYQYSSIKDLQFKTLQGNLNEIVLEQLMKEYPKGELCPRQVMPMISGYAKQQFVFKQMWGFQKRKGVVQFQGKIEESKQIKRKDEDSKNTRMDMMMNIPLVRLAKGNQQKYASSTIFSSLPFQMYEQKLKKLQSQSQSPKRKRLQKPQQKLSPPRPIPLSLKDQNNPVPYNNSAINNNILSSIPTTSTTTTSSSQDTSPFELELNLLQLEEQFANLDTQTRMRIFQQLYQFKQLNYQQLIGQNKDIINSNNSSTSSLRQLAIMRELFNHPNNNNNKINNKNNDYQQQQEQEDQQHDVQQQQQEQQQADIIFNNKNINDHVQYHKKLLQSFTGPIQIQLQDDQDEIDNDNNSNRAQIDVQLQYQYQYQQQQPQQQQQRQRFKFESKQQQEGQFNQHGQQEQQQYQSQQQSSSQQQQLYNFYKNSIKQNNSKILINDKKITKISELNQLLLARERVNKLNNGNNNNSNNSSNSNTINDNNNINKINDNNNNTATALVSQNVKNVNNYHRQQQKNYNNHIPKQTESKYKQVLQQLKLINETFNGKFQLTHHDDNDINYNNDDDQHQLHQHQDIQLDFIRSSSSSLQRLPQLLPIDKNKRLQQTLIEAKQKLTKMIQKQTHLLHKEKLNLKQLTMKEKELLMKKQQQQQQLLQQKIIINNNKTDRDLNVLGDFHLQEEQEFDDEIHKQQPDNFYQTLKKYYQPKQLINNDSNKIKSQKLEIDKNKKTKKSQSQIYFAKNVPGSALAEFITDKKSFSQTLQSLTSNNKLSSKLQKISRQQIFDQIYQVAKEKQKRGHNLKMTYKKISYQLRGGEEKNQIKITQGSFTTDDLNWIEDLPQKTKYNLSQSTDFGEKLIDQPSEDICQQQKQQKKKKKKKKKKNKQKKQVSQQNFDKASVSSFNQDQQDLEPLNQFRKKSIYDIFKLRKTLGWSQGQSIQQYLEANQTLEREKQQQLLMEKKIEIYEKTGQKNQQKNGDRQKALSKQKKAKKQNYTEDELKLFQFLQNLQIKDENRQKCVVTQETLQRFICKRKQIKSLEIFSKNKQQSQKVNESTQKDNEGSSDYFKASTPNPKSSKPKNKKKKK